MTKIKGDFIGFTYAGIHSSNLALVRTSQGNRYNEDLLPEIQDKTVPVPGGDGVYYFGSYYRDRTFDFPIAYDQLTEEIINNLQIITGDRRVHPLIFDERPYKVYYAKVSKSPSIDYLAFGDVGTRVYKGEGMLSLATFSPFARSRFKFLESYPLSEYPNREEWIGASGIISKGSLDQFNSNTIPLYNGGQLPTDFILQIPFDGNGVVVANSIFLRGRPEDILTWTSMPRQSSDWGVQINTKLNLIEGITNTGQITGTVYNRYKTGGNFFKIPRGYFNLDFTSAITTTTLPTIIYDYLYF